MKEEIERGEDSSKDSTIDDPLFNEIKEEKSSLFKNKQLLHVGHVPNSDRIVGRDEEIKNIAKELFPIIEGDPPNNCIIYGKTGTGKSLVSRHVLDRAKIQAENNDYRIADIYIDCSEYPSHVQAVKRIGRILKNKAGKENIKIPKSGISRNEYYRYVWDLLENNFSSSIIILDEIDKLENDDILMQLSRAKEAGKVNTDIGVIAISNKIGYRDTLSERVKSSIEARDYVFHPYDGRQLEQILERRKDAFYEGVLESDVIPLVAALSAQEHGDARKAVEILKNAGMVAEDEGSDTIEERHVRQAKDRAEMNRFHELIKGSTKQTKIVLYSFADLVLNSEEDSFSTKEIYDHYLNICSKYDIEPYSNQRVYEFLKEQAFLGVIESKKTSGGRGEGMYLEHRLIIRPKVVKKVITESSSVF